MQALSKKGLNHKAPTKQRYFSGSHPESIVLLVGRGSSVALNLLLLGPQGSGKGTQSKRIAAEYGIPHIATGDILRDHMARDTELGRRVRPIYDRGDLVPDDLMIDLIRDRLSRGDTLAGFVLDGFPRTMAQAVALDETLHEIERDLTLVLELQVEDEIGRERLLRRAELEGRPDDTPEAIDKRLALYHAQTEPLVAYYRARGKLVGIHGERPIDEVFAEIERVLDQADDLVRARRRSGTAREASRVDGAPR